jgi:hypothetical protein
MATRAGDVKVRLYCQGIGDCILVDLPKDDGGRYHLLVDCGVHSLTPAGSDRMADVIRDLLVRTGGRLDAVAGTHEHWDHLSAFLTEEEAWADFSIGDVWFSWAEDPEDEQARRLDRFKADATAAVAGMRGALGVVGDNGEVAQPAFGVHARAGAAVDTLAGFVFGARGERVRAAREALRALAPGGKAKVLKPGTAEPMQGLSAMKAWVLGPPTDDTKLKLHDNPGNEYRLAMGASLGFAAAESAVRMREGTLTVSDDPSSPFDGSQGQCFSELLDGDWSHLDEMTQAHLWAHYFEGSDPDGANPKPLAQSRRIDGAWLGDAVRFALQMDRNTNNSSLVLALELGEDGNVLLLAADAQGGAWASFEELELADGGRRVTAKDLLARTAFYKVGHHGSVNATAKSALEAMDPARLVAFVPVDADVAKNKCKWSDFPAAKLTGRLRELTDGRLIHADDGWLKDPHADCPFDGRLGAALKRVDHGVTAGTMAVPWVELTFRA